MNRLPPKQTLQTPPSDHQSKPQSLRELLWQFCTRVVKQVVPRRMIPDHSPTHVKNRDLRNSVSVVVDDADGQPLVSAFSSDIKTYFNRLLQDVEAKNPVLYLPEELDCSLESLRQCTQDQLEILFEQDVLKGGRLFSSLQQSDPDAFAEFLNQLHPTFRQHILGEFSLKVPVMSSLAFIGYFEADAKAGGHMLYHLAEHHPEILGERLKTMPAEDVFKLMQKYENHVAEVSPEQVRNLMKLLHQYLPEGIERKIGDESQRYDIVSMALRFCGSELSPEAVAVIVQEKHQLAGLTVGEMATIPMTSNLTGLTFQITDIKDSGEESPWFNEQCQKARKILGEMPASALLGEDYPAGHNAYAINVAAMLEAARNSGDQTLESTCRHLDEMHTVGLPAFNMTNSEKAIAPNDGYLYQELNRLTPEQMYTLSYGPKETANDLLKDLGWLPLMRSGDEGRGIMNVREFLGLFFSGQFRLRQPRQVSA